MLSSCSVASRLVYCWSFQRLHCIQNSAAKILTQSRTHNPNFSLPTSSGSQSQRIQFKICLSTFQSLHAPEFLKDLITPHKTICQRRLLLRPPPWTKPRSTGDGSFRAAASVLWKRTFRIHYKTIAKGNLQQKYANC